MLGGGSGEEQGTGAGVGAVGQGCLRGRAAFRGHGESRGKRSVGTVTAALKRSAPGAERGAHWCLAGPTPAWCPGPDEAIIWRTWNGRGWKGARQPRRRPEASSAQTKLPAAVARQSHRDAPARVAVGFQKACLGIFSGKRKGLGLFSLKIGAGVRCLFGREWISATL